jgi:hypothetical protein
MTTMTRRMSWCLQEDEARERVRAAERRAAAAQQRSLDKKIQALNGMCVCVHVLVCFLCICMYIVSKSMTKEPWITRYMP